MQRRIVCYDSLLGTFFLKKKFCFLTSARVQTVGAVGTYLLKRKVAILFGPEQTFSTNARFKKKYMSEPNCNPKEDQEGSTDYSGSDNDSDSDSDGPYKWRKQYVCPNCAVGTNDGDDCNRCDDEFYERTMSECQQERTVSTRR